MHATLHACRMAAIGIGKSQHWLYANAILRIEDKNKWREGTEGKLKVNCNLCIMF